MQYSWECQSHEKKGQGIITETAIKRQSDLALHSSSALRYSHSLFRQL